MLVSLPFFFWGGFWGLGEKKWNLVSTFFIFWGFFSFAETPYFLHTFNPALFSPRRGRRVACVGRACSPSGRKSPANSSRVYRKVSRCFRKKVRGEIIYDTLSSKSKIYASRSSLFSKRERVSHDPEKVPPLSVSLKMETDTFQVGHTARGLTPTSSAVGCTDIICGKCGEIFQTWGIWAETREF